jgi:hypothetical protein
MGDEVMKLIVSCPSCKAKYDVGKYDPGTKFKCQKCQKSLIVPEGAGAAAAKPEPMGPAKKARGGRGGKKRATRGIRRGGGTRRRGREEEYDDEDDRRPFPTAKKGPNVPLIVGAGGGVLVLIIILVVVISNTMKEAEERARRDKEDVIEVGGGPAPEEVADTKEDTSRAAKKPKKRPKKHETGEFVEETYDKDDKRTKDKEATAEVRVQRWRLRKHIFEVDSSIKGEAEDLLKQFRQNFDDPPAATECLSKVEALGIKAFPAALNFITQLNHKSEGDAMAASQLFETIVRMARKAWDYENEYNYGMFESGEEKWNAIIEMKELWQKKKSS